MTAFAVDALSADDAATALAACCGARRWVDGMLARRPFGDPATLYAAADEVAADLRPDDWLEAFAHHPRIGDVASLRARFGVRSGAWSEGEQAGMAGAGDDVIERLAAGNQRYEERFGHLFIVCASGKRADEMLDLLEARLPNEPPAELAIAAAEQRKITRLRLEKLVADRAVRSTDRAVD